MSSPTVHYLRRRLLGEGGIEIVNRILKAMSFYPLVPEHEIEVYMRGANIYRGEPLTKVQLDALRYLSRGLTLDQTADALFKSPDTIKTQMKSVRYKLHAKTTMHACCEAIRQGLIP